MRRSWMAYIGFVQVAVSMQMCTAAADTIHNLRLTAEKRERALDGAFLVWSASSVFTERQQSQTAPNLSHIRRAAKAEAIAQLDRHRVLDAKRRAEYIAIHVMERAGAATPGSSNWKGTWTFQRKGASSSCTGNCQSRWANRVYSRYFDGSLGVATNESVEDPRYPKHTKIVPLATSVWQCSGPCVSRRPPSEPGPAFGPEDWVVLLGHDPTRMHEVSWATVKVRQGRWILEGATPASSQLMQHIRIDLSMNHGAAPARLIVRRGGWISDIRVLSYRRSMGIWIPSRVERTMRWRGGEKERILWVLRRDSQGAAQQLVVPLRQAVVDVRLLGRNVSVSDLSAAERIKDPRIVRYRWTGSLPAIDELADIRDRQLSLLDRFQHRNEHSVLFWLVGALLIACGLAWSRRQRLRAGSPVGGSSIPT
jgi:hypothetical protein